MKDKVSHGGSAITIREYEVRDIDEFGDAQDINHYGSKAEAMAAAARLLSDGAAKAIVVELHTSKRPAFLFKNPTTYKRIAEMGDRDALLAGGWI